MGKHARPSHAPRHRKPSAPYRAAAVTASAATATASAGVIVAATSGHAATPPQPQLAAHVIPVTQAPQLHVISVEQPAAVTTVTVEQGNTLSGIAQEHCGTVSDWTGIYLKNKKTIGSDYNLIQAGQELVLDCRAVNVPVVTTTDSYVRHARVTVARPYHRTYHRTYGHVGGGNLSFGGLEALWVAAGGPAWAEASAARVAECESGGRQYAYNPSGASGYFQILGQVIPGDIYDPMVNARNAVAKFEASGDTWAQWVCKP